MNSNIWANGANKVEITKGQIGKDANSNMQLVGNGVVVSTDTENNRGANVKGKDIAIEGRSKAEVIVTANDFGRKDSGRGFYYNVQKSNGGKDINKVFSIGGSNDWRSFATAWNGSKHNIRRDITEFRLVSDVD